MAVSPLGGNDATVVQPTVQGELIDKHRVAVSIADPHSEAARLSLAIVDGAYRLPTSNPAISDKLTNTAFGELSVAALTPLIQLQFPYSVNSRLVSTVAAGTGTATVASSLLTLSTGTTTASDLILRSVQDARYHPGQGTLARWTSTFDSAGVAGTEAIMGYGNAEDGFFFGYNGATFGILHRHDGAVEHQTLTVSAGAGTAGGTITITLDDVATEVEVALNDTPQDVVRKIVATSFAAWTAKAHGTAVIFISHHAKVHSGSFAFADTDTTGTAASFAETITGVAATDDWVAQADWNGDVMDGTGDSGVTLDVAKGNVYQVQFQWLGSGPINFFLEDPTTKKFILVHEILYVNANTTPSIQNPSLPFCGMVDNKATTSDITVKTSSAGVFTEGDVRDFGLQNSFSATLEGDLTTETCIMVVKNKEIYQGKQNRVSYLPSFMTFSANGAGAAKFTTLRIVRNPVLGGLTSYTDIDTSDSVMAVDTASTTRTGGEVIATFRFGKAISGFALDAEALTGVFGEQPPGTVMAVTVQTDGGTSDVDIGVIWKELF